MTINHNELALQLHKAHEALDIATCNTHNSELINKLSGMMKDIRVMLNGSYFEITTKPSNPSLNDLKQSLLATKLPYDVRD